MERCRRSGPRLSPFKAPRVQVRQWITRETAFQCDSAKQSDPTGADENFDFVRSHAIRISDHFRAKRIDGAENPPACATLTAQTRHPRASYRETVATGSFSQGNLELGLMVSEGGSPDKRNAGNGRRCKYRQSPPKPFADHAHFPSLGHYSPSRGFNAGAACLFQGALRFCATITFGSALLVGELLR